MICGNLGLTVTFVGDNMNSRYKFTRQEKLRQGNIWLMVVLSLTLVLKRPFEIHDGKCNNAKDNTIKRGCHFTLSAV